MFFQNLSIDRLIESNDIHYVENFLPGAIDYNGEKLEDMVDSLGFDKALIKAESVVKRFDNKEQLPLFGCGLQVLKFLKLIEVKNTLNHYKINNVLKVLILMSVDFNVYKDLQMFNYNNKKMFARDMLVNKVEEFQDKIELINLILQESFSCNSVELWFNFINNFDANKNETLKIFKTKLILKFLIYNNIGDNTNVRNIEKFKDIENSAKFEYIIHNFK